MVADKAAAGENEDENAEFDVMSDADIVNAVLNHDSHFYEGESVTNTTLDETANISTADDNQDEEYEPVPDQSALNSIDTIITWAEENQLPLERQFLLREIRGNILDKIVNKD